MTVLSSLRFGRTYWITNPDFEAEKAGAQLLLDQLGHGHYFADTKHEYSFVFTGQEDRQVSASDAGERQARVQLLQAQTTAQQAKAAYEANRSEATFNHYRQASQELGEAMSKQRDAQDAFLRTVLQCARHAIRVHFDPLTNRFSLPPEPDLSELSKLLSTPERVTHQVH